MATDQAISEESQEKTQGDKLEHATDESSSTGVAPSRPPLDDERKPADEPLK